jgi:hypothetical protein
MLRRKCLLKRVIEGKIEESIELKEDEEEDVNIYWITFRKKDDSGN